MSKRNKRIWTTKLQMYYPEITEAALSPDGECAVYALKVPLMTKKKSIFISHLYLVATSGGEPIQLTNGEYNNHLPKWSPDNQFIAFLSNRTGKNNIYVIRREGGEAWQLTNYGSTDVSYFDWAPDGKSLAFLMPEPPSKKKQKAIKKKKDPELWDRDYAFNHVFWIPFHIGEQGLPVAKQVTSGRFHTFGMAWMPEGDALAIVHQPTPLAEDWPEACLAMLPFNPADVSLPVKKKALKLIAEVSLWGGHPFPSPDGMWIACATADKPVAWAGADKVVLYTVDGTQTRVLPHTPDGQSWVIGWSHDCDSVIVGEVCGVDAHVYALPITGDPPVPILTTPTFKTALHTNHQGSFIYAEESFHQPNALNVYHMEAKQNQSLLTPSLPNGWPTDQLPAVHLRKWHAEDGLEIEGTVIYPLNYQPDTKYPLIVEVHGGPMGVFNRRYLGWSGRYCDVLSAAEKGFVILRVNPRGSSGYGKAFRFANYNDWGFGDFKDILSGVNMLIAEGLVDEDRMGIMGWSYGGYMTSWAITQTHRFGAACVGAGVTNLMSFNGTSDIPGFLPDYFSAEFWDDLEPYVLHSPMFNVKNVSTPTLIQHGSIDERVPLEQGLQLYNALKRQNVPTEMVLYPRQHHSIAEPRLRIDMRKRPMLWFSRWLLDE